MRESVVSTHLLRSSRRGLGKGKNSGKTLQTLFPGLLHSIQTSNLLRERAAATYGRRVHQLSSLHAVQPAQLATSRNENSGLIVTRFQCSPSVIKRSCQRRLPLLDLLTRSAASATPVGRLFSCCQKIKKSVRTTYRVWNLFLFRCDSTKQNSSLESPTSIIVNERISRTEGGSNLRCEKETKQKTEKQKTRKIPEAKRKTLMKHFEKEKRQTN